MQVYIQSSEFFVRFVCLFFYQRCIWSPTNSCWFASGFLSKPLRCHPVIWTVFFVIVNLEGEPLGLFTPLLFFFSWHFWLYSFHFLSFLLSFQNFAISSCQRLQWHAGHWQRCIGMQKNRWWRLLFKGLQWTNDTHLESTLTWNQDGRRGHYPQGGGGQPTALFSALDPTLPIFCILFLVQPPRWLLDGKDSSLQ